MFSVPLLLGFLFHSLIYQEKQSSLTAMICFSINSQSLLHIDLIPFTWFGFWVAFETILLRNSFQTSTIFFFCLFLSPFLSNGKMAFEKLNYKYFTDAAFTAIHLMCGTKRYSSLSCNEGVKSYLRGTHDPNLSGNSDIKSSLIRSFIGPRIITGLV